MCGLDVGRLELAYCPCGMITNHAVLTSRDSYESNTMQAWTTAYRGP